jgi:hypothetical protein
VLRPRFAPACARFAGDSDFVNVVPRRLNIAWHYQSLVVSVVEVVDGQQCSDPTVLQIRCVCRFPSWMVACR